MVNEMKNNEAILSKDVSGRMEKFNSIKSALIPFVGLVLMSIIFEIASQNKLLLPANLITILNQSFSVMIIALGATFVVSHGGLDISYGSVFGISILCAAAAAHAGFIWLSFPIAVAAAALCALINGGISIFCGVSPFITSICILFIGRGILNTVCSSSQIAIPTSMLSIDNWQTKLLVLVATITVTAILFEKTKIGRNNKAIGGNVKSAEQAGVNIKVYRMIAYLISGITIGIASFFSLVRMGSVSSATGQGLEMSIITALVLGGMPMTGGANSRIISAIIGSVSIIVLKNGLIILGVNDKIIEGIQGIIILAIILVSYKKEKDALLG
jgi:ribose transport system permease protein